MQTLSLVELLPDFVLSGRQLHSAGWDRIQLGRAELDAAINSCHDGVEGTPAKHANSMRVMTANVNTLCQLGRIDILDARFAAADVDIVGVQESRTQGDHDRLCTNYRMLSSGATPGGHCGVQLWISKKLHCRKVNVDPCSSRLLLAHVQLADGLEIICVVAYAPIEDAPAADKQQFWESLSHNTHKMRKSYPKAAVIIMIDANARVGSVLSKSVRGARPQHENDNGLRLRTAMDDLDCVLLNTVTPAAAGATWFGGVNQNKGHRIDYIAVDSQVAHLARQGRADDTIDLATQAKTDHIPVWFDVEVVSAPGRSAACNDDKTDAFSGKFEATSIADSQCQQRFQSRLWSALHKAWEKRPELWQNSQTSLDSRVRWWTQSFQGAARACFKASAERRPNKQWISDASWAVVRRVAPLRRRLVRLHALQARFALRCVVREWHRIHVQGSEHLDGPDSRQGRHPLQTIPVIEPVGACSTMRRMNFDIARQYIRVVCAGAASRACVRDDRDSLHQRIARDAQIAADNGHVSELYKHVRILSGIPPKVVESVKDTNGQRITSKADVEARWVQHFAGVFGAEVKPSWLLATSPKGDRISRSGEQPMSVRRADVDKLISKLPNNKGVGPDMIPAELIKASGSAGSCFMQHILNDMLWCRWFPTQWRGGALVKLWKRKGDPACCDDYRGLLLADHFSKVCTGLLQSQATEKYHSFIPETQFGCARGRGTLQATAFTQFFLDACRLAELSLAILYVDLSKAFDFAIREVLLGWRPSFDGDKLQLLMSHGLSRNDALEMIRYIDETGGLLREIGVDEDVRALFSSLHDGAWFVIGKDGDCTSKPALISSRGGRQGCRVGAMVFNFIYCKCLKELRSSLAARGIITRFSGSASMPFWAESSAAFSADQLHKASADERANIDCDAPVVEATYVDDEALYLSSSSPKVLAYAVNTLLELLVAAFKRYAFVINWKRGKTEIMLKMRGKNAKRVYTDIVGLHEGKQVLVLPDGSGFVHVVQQYKHVGTVADVDCSLMPEVIARVSAAMNCYAPLAVKVFGSKEITNEVKLQLADSLIFLGC